MTHRRDPDRYANLPVEMVPFAVVRPLIEEMYREDPHVPNDVAPLFTEQHGKYERVGGARFFAARVDGRLADNCELYQEGDDAQVEHVEACGAERLIVADEEDWPRHLYARLGFDQIGRTWEYLRPPHRDGGAM